MNVLILALRSGRRGSALADAQFLIDHGGQVTLVTSAVGDLELDPRMRVFELGPVEARFPPLRAQRLLVLQLPRVAVLGVRRAVRALAGVRGLSRPARLLVPPLNGIEKARRVVAGRLNAQFHRGAYGTLRPWLLWRIVRRNVLPALDVDAYDIILVSDPISIATGWHLARAHPRPRVTTRLDREVLVRGAGPAEPAASPAGPAR